VLTPAQELPLAIAIVRHVKDRSTAANARAKEDGTISWRTEIEAFSKEVIVV
jgi:hypothetical protein